jgi:hypothetical protein
VLALAVLLTANPSDTDSLLIGLLAKLAGVGENEVQKLKESFPYVVLHGLLVVLVFFFMTDVFRLNANIICNYAYVRSLERDIRRELGLAASHAAFTKESAFYDEYRIPWNWTVKFAYALIVGGMLALFLTFRITSDWPSSGIDGTQFGSPQAAAIWFRKHFLLLVDIIVGGLTVLMYVRYARLSFFPPKSKPVETVAA